jgi:hypothetical protein
MDLDEVLVRTADDRDVGAITNLRCLWSSGPDEPDFEHRIAAWLAAEGGRRTVWLATLPDLPIGMASVFEYRRMPRPGRADSRLGLREQHVRARGIPQPRRRLDADGVNHHGRRGARLCTTGALAHPALTFYRRAGFIVPDDTAGDHRLLVRGTPI